MKKRLFALILAGCICMAGLSGCGGGKPEETPAETPVEEGETAPAETPAADAKAPASGNKCVTFNIGQEPTTLDPSLNSGLDGTLVLSQMYEGLLREIDHKMVPAAAESYDVSEDELTYTFHLRDAKWSDGEAVKAKDFEFAWKRAQDPAVASSYSWIFDSGNIASYKAVDDKTLEVKLSSPSPVFLQLLQNSTFMPLREDKVDYLEGGWALDPAKVVCNGAFYMESYQPGDKVVLKKNPNYWDIENVKLDEMQGLMIVDQTTALTGYESGQIDAIFNVPPAEIPRLLNEEPNFQAFQDNGNNYYCFNLQKKPFDDVRVRQALSYAIDRKAICNDVLKDGSMPAHSMIPGVIYDSEGNVFNEKSGDYGIPTDLSKLEEAKKLLADAGYPNGEGFPVTEILYNTNETNKAQAETLQQMWKDNLNIETKLVNMESAVFHQTRVNHNFEICKGGWGGDYPDPLTYLNLFVTADPCNYAAWSDPAYDKLIGEAKVLSGKARFDKFYEAEKIMMESYVYMPISYSVKQSLVNSDRVTGWEMTSMSTPIFVRADIVG